MLQEIEAATRILNKKIDPLEVADKFFHNIFELLREGISNRYPALEKKEIEQKIRNSMNFTEKIKSLRKRRNGLG